MENCICSECNKRFFYDLQQVPYRAKEDHVCRLTVYAKIMSCPYCGTEYLLDQYYEEWD
jgi:hypothetical protein